MFYHGRYPCCLDVSKWICARFNFHAQPCHSNRCRFSLTPFNADSIWNQKTSETVTFTTMPLMNTSCHSMSHKDDLYTQHNLVAEERCIQSLGRFTPHSITYFRRCKTPALTRFRFHLDQWAIHKSTVDQRYTKFPKKIKRQHIHLHLFQPSQKVIFRSASLIIKPTCSFIQVFAIRVS
jgi:hypothetical protein